MPALSSYVLLFLGILAAANTYIRHKRLLPSGLAILCASASAITGALIISSNHNDLLRFAPLCDKLVPAYATFTAGALGTFMIIMSASARLAQRCAPMIKPKLRYASRASKGAQQKMWHAIRIGAALSLLFALLIYACMNWNTFICNTDYACLTNKDRQLIDNRLIGVVFPLINLLVPFLALVTTMAFAARLRVTAWLCLAALPPLALIPLVKGSRLIALTLAGAGFCTFILTRKHRALASVPYFFLALLAFSIAIETRGQSVFGLSCLGGNIAEGIINLPANAASLIFNALWGVYLLFCISSSSLPHDYSLQYKILSFSPLPSIVDRFDTILPLEQIRLASYIPYSAFGEAIVFGPAWVLLLLCLLLAVFTVMDLFFLQCSFATPPRREEQTVSLLIPLLPLAMASQYPIRNCMRLFYILLAVGTAMILIRRGRAPAFRARDTRPIRNRKQ
jgi:hypothetical protein